MYVQKMYIFQLEKLYIIYTYVYNLDFILTIDYIFE